MSKRGFEFSVREADICFIGGRDEAETRAASLRAKELAEKLGGAPEDYADLTLGLWMVVHGAAMLLIAKTILPQDAKAARQVITASVAAIVGAPDGF